MAHTCMLEGSDLGGLIYMFPREIFKEWCNLVHFDAYFLSGFTLKHYPYCIFKKLL